MKNYIILIVFLFSSLISIAQLQKDPEIRLTLRDGSVLSGTSKMPPISLKTTYGKLEIPAAAVTLIEVGIPGDVQTKEKVKSLIKHLNGSSEEMRKSAYEALVALDIKAIPAISEFIASKEYQGSSFSDYTAEAALAELTTIFNVNDASSTNDVVHLDFMYVIGGEYDFKSISLATPYGTLSIPKEKIKQIEILYFPTDGNSELLFTLFANKHISSNQTGGWLKTGIMVKTSQRLTIKANGEIVLASLSNGKYNPDGVVKGQPNSDEVSVDGYDPNVEGGNFPKYGQVVYKISETGNIVKAGANYNGIAKGSGMLYVSIYETVFNAANTGTYQVKISLLK